MNDEWAWKMAWCKVERLPPAQKWAWDKAEEAWKARTKEEEIQGQASESQGETTAEPKDANDTH